MSSLKRFLLIAAILVSCIGCDQMSKVAAKKYLAQAQPSSYFSDMFRLQYMENTGGFLGLGSALPAEHRFWIFSILTGIAVAGMLVFVLFYRGLQPAIVAGCSLIIAGGTGNLIDRVLHNGAVIDFMNIGVGGLRTGIFNVADVAIMIGAGTLFFLGLQSGQTLKGPSLPS